MREGNEANEANASAGGRGTSDTEEMSATAAEATSRTGAWQHAEAHTRTPPEVTDRAAVSAEMARLAVTQAHAAHGVRGSSTGESADLHARFPFELGSPLGEAARRERTVSPELDDLVEATAVGTTIGRPEFAATGQGRRRRRGRCDGNASMHLVREQCRQLALALGFASSVAGEGTTFVTLAAATALAADGGEVTLLDLNWQHPTLHELCGAPQSPGLAEWLRDECALDDACYPIADQLHILPAGDLRRGGVEGGRDHRVSDPDDDAVVLLRRLIAERLPVLRQARPGFHLVDLPPLVTCPFGPLAARTVEALVLVVHAGITPAALVAQACYDAQHQTIPIEGVVLNQIDSHIPRWLRQLL